VTARGADPGRVPAPSRRTWRAPARSLLASLALAAASLLLLLGLLELGVRGLVPESRWRFHDGASDWRLDDEIGWVHRPNLDVSSEAAGIALAFANGQAKPVFRLDERERLVLSRPRLAGRIRALGSGPRRWIQHSALYRLIQPGLQRLRARLTGWNERCARGPVRLASRASRPGRGPAARQGVRARCASRASTASASSFASSAWPAGFR
jgi:hypothetical protein